MQVIRTLEEMRSTSDYYRRNGRLALVPTMGALHDGHLSLVEVARNFAEAVVASIFVNPKQFGPNEDYDRYPRQEEADLAMLEAAGAEAVWLPEVETMYPEGYATTVRVDGMTDVLCGASRPGHFDGVATVVAKLLLQTGVDVAVFGEKDYQQLLVIRRMVADMNLPVEIVGAPILREVDGLAMSSRNRYLDPRERSIAPELYAILQEIAAAIHDGMPIEEAEEQGRQAVLSAGFRQVDYFECRDAQTLERPESLEAPLRLFVAARLGKTRLIDNIDVLPKR